MLRYVVEVMYDGTRISPLVALGIRLVQPVPSLKKRGDFFQLWGFDVAGCMGSGDASFVGEIFYWASKIVILPSHGAIPDEKSG